MIIDVHAHLDSFDELGLDEIQEDGDIKIVITNSINISSCKKNLKISNRYKKIKLAVGLFPERELKRKDFKLFLNFINKNKDKIVALGEIGLDLYHTKNNFEIQKEIFIKQLNLAKELNLPVIVHARKAEKEVLEILEEYTNVKKILHCFSGNFKLIQRAKEMGCYFSIPAIVVRSEHFQKMVRDLPRDKLLTETDSPLLSPFKERENKPAFISESIKQISKMWCMKEKEVEKIIERNYKTIFR